MAEPKLSETVRRVIEQRGIIPKNARESRPTLHWCPDWDFALVHDDGSLEFDCCTCGLSSRKKGT